MLGQDVTAFVPESVNARLHEKFREGKKEDRS